MFHLGALARLSDIAAVKEPCILDTLCSLLEMQIVLLFHVSKDGTRQPGNLQSEKSATTY